MKKRQITEYAICLILFGILWWVLSCAANPVTGQRELMLLSEEGEVRLGQKTDAQVVETYGAYDDSELTDYIDSLCQRMAKRSHRPRLPFTFKILDTPVVNAFAVPGGYVYLTRGILSYLNNEAELAGVIGHEIGHITARHSAKQYSRAQLAQLGLEMGTILSEGFREYAGLAQFGVGMLFLKFSRDNERQADDLGVQYATKAGFDASHMANFFATLERLHPSEDRSGLPDWCSTHPNPPDRIRQVQRKAREWARKLEMRNLQVNRDIYLRRIDGLVFGEDPRQGYVDNGVFYHPKLRFQFPVPANWKVNNTPAQVQMVCKRQDGAILFCLESGYSPKDTATKFIAKTRARIIRSDAITVNRLPAHRLISDIAAERGSIRVMSYFIQKDQNICVFHGFSHQTLFERYQAIFHATMSRFKTLTDSKRINVKPDRLRVRVTKNTGTLKEALQSLGVPDQKLKEVALLNGRHLHDTVAANTLLKVVEKGS